MKKYVVLAGVILLMASLVMGCGGSEETTDGTSGAALGDRVTVDYTGTLGDGTIFDSSIGKEPLTFVIGDGSVISGFDKAVMGMEVGDIKTFTIPPAEGYGEYREDLVVTLSCDTFEELPEVGQKVPLQNVISGQTLYFTVIAVSDDGVTLDGNSPLAGQSLTFEIELLALEPAGTFAESPEE
jgi:peptidylprolyl isomerase